MKNIENIGRMTLLRYSPIKNNMDDEVFEKAKEEDMSKDEAEELQELMDETGLDVDEAHGLWQEL